MSTSIIRMSVVAVAVAFLLGLSAGLGGASPISFTTGY